METKILTSKDDSLDMTDMLKKQEIILMLLSSGSFCYASEKIQFFYRAWFPLNKEVKDQLNVYVGKHLPPNLTILYKAMEEAFLFWDKTQNEEGAPGWDCRDAVAYVESSDCYKEIRQLLEVTENIWRKFTGEVINRD